MAWLGTWQKRVKLTIDNTDIDAALSNFPILVYLSTASGRNDDDVSFVFDELTDDANRKKIAVTTSDGETECYVEIEKWDDANEKAWLWVKVPSVSNSADTELYLYYDVDHADNDAYVGDPNSVPAENVWDSYFKFVCHMQDDPDTSNVRDSTTEDNDGAKTAAGAPAVVAAQISNGQDLDGVDDRISLGDKLDPGTADFTWEALINSDNIAVYQAIFTKQTSTGHDSTTDCIGFYVESSKLYFILSDSSGTITDGYSTNTLSSTTWTHVAAVFDRDGNLTFYKNGTADGTTNISARSSDLDNTDPFYIGRRLYAATPRWFAGLIDEVRVSIGIARSAAWIKASSETQIDDLLDFGAEEVGVVAPTNTTQACTNVEATSCTGNGNITDTGGENCSRRGFCYKVGTSGDPTTADSVAYDDDGFGTGAYTKAITGLTAGTSYRVRAYAVNSAGTGYGATVQITTDIGKTLQAIWNTRKSISDTSQLIFNIRALVSDTLQAVWNTRAAISDTLQAIWQVLAKIKVSDTIQLVWDVKKAISKTVQPLWNVRELLSDTIQAIWDVRKVTAKTVELVYDVRTFIAGTVQTIWKVKATISDTLQAVWDVRKAIFDTSQFIWGVRTFVSDSLQAVWKVRATISDTAQLVWNIRTAVSDTVQMVWSVRKKISDTVQALWSIREAISELLQLIWRVDKFLVLARMFLHLGTKSRMYITIDTKSRMDITIGTKSRMYISLKGGGND